MGMFSTVGDIMNTVGDILIILLFVNFCSSKLKILIKITSPDPKGKMGNDILSEHSFLMNLSQIALICSISIIQMLSPFGHLKVYFHN